MRFVLDEDVDAKAVGSFLRQRGHDRYRTDIATRPASEAAAANLGDLSVSSDPSKIVQLRIPVS